VANLTKLGVAAIQRDVELQDQLTRSANRLTEMLRWTRRYEEAIKLQEQLSLYLPDDAASLRVMASTLKIEAGKVEEGFKELHGIAEQDPDNILGWITLGSSYLWTWQYAEAEKYFYGSRTGSRRD
jgi:predicted Zn-dependent protease